MLIIISTFIILGFCKIYYNAKEYYELVGIVIHPYFEYFTITYSTIYIFETCINYLVVIREQIIHGNF